MSRVVIVGAGRQGPAAAYDLAKFGEIKKLTIADFDLDAARAACSTVNGLLGDELAQSASVDAASESELSILLADFDLAVAAAPYKLNPLISKSGLKVGCHVVDMGVDTPDALEIHELSSQAKAKGSSIVTDCGVAPGLVNILAYKLLEEHPDTKTVRLYCGGLPESAEAPFFHRVGFSVESLIGEYIDDVDSLRGGKVVQERALEELEEVAINGIGDLEAVTTSGGTGTAAHNLADRLDNYVYKTLRYPGHWTAMRLLRDAGFWSDQPLPTGEVPLSVTAQIMERFMVVPADRDIVVARVEAEGPTGIHGYDLVDRFDSETGLTAMQRTTGFSTAIVAHEVLAGRVKAGCRACEEAVDPTLFFNEAAKRGIRITPTVPE